MPPFLFNLISVFCESFSTFLENEMLNEWIPGYLYVICMKYYKAAQTVSQGTDKLNIEVWAPVWYSIEQLFV